ncbi:MAG: type IV secretory system conjugative DNA transfer family protein [Bacilli bacterium]|nr:type IV secretory system conjugative DNA transfer family protein [Bacilli bacterium]
MKLKLKIKVTKTDLTVFILFCIVLLYLSSISVSNIFAIINTGEFKGFNPIDGLVLPYLPVTLVVFIGVLGVIFLSVSSTIFEFSKGGPGLKVGPKDSDGYSRWMDEKEMKNSWKIYKVGVQDEDAEHGGVVFVNDGKNMWVDDSEYHTLVVGVTGSGKTSAVVDPLVYSLAKAGESMVFTDPKGEIYRNHTTYLKHKGYNIVVLNFRNPQNGNAWNPLMVPYKLYKEGNRDKALELIDDVANNVVKNDGPQQDPFWQDSAADYLAANILGLIEDAKENEINLKSVNVMTTVGEDKFGGNSTYIKEYFKLKGEQSSTYMLASNTINAPQDTKGSILSTFRLKIRNFGSRDNLTEMLSYSDFDIADIGKKKTAVFIIVQDEKKTYHALATIFIKQAYEVLIDVAQNSPGSHLPFRTNFILDEFANMPALKDITTMVTAARSRHIRFTFIIQNYAQLDQVYGKEEAQTIRSNCANLMYLLTTELAALEEISKLCGEVKSKKDDKTASVPLITVADLQKLQLNEVIIIRNRQNPFRTKLKQAFNIDWGDKEWQEPAELPVREAKEVALFDVKNFVDVRKRSEMKKNGEQAGSPFGGGSSMFGGGSSSMFGDPMGGSSMFGGGSKSSGSLPSFSDIMAGGMAGLNSQPKRFPTFEEFMAERNKKAETKPRPQIDIDELVKKIDAQIARLEEEEKQENAKKERLTTEQSNPFNPFEGGDKKVFFEDEVKEPKFEEKKIEPEITETISKPVSGPTFSSLFDDKVDVVEDVVTTVPETIEVQKTVSTPTQPVESTVSQTSPNLNFQSMINDNVGSVESAPVVEPKVEVQQVVPKQPNQVVVPVQNVQTVQPVQSVVTQPVQQVITQPTQPQVITQTTVPIKVDTQSQVLNNDDEYFDDFFE